MSDAASDRQDALDAIRARLLVAEADASEARRVAVAAERVAVAAQQEVATVRAELVALDGRVGGVEAAQSSMHLDLLGLKRHAYGAGAVGAGAAGGSAALIAGLLWLLGKALELN